MKSRILLTFLLLSHQQKLKTKCSRKWRKIEIDSLSNHFNCEIKKWQGQSQIVWPNALLNLRNLVCLKLKSDN